MKLPSALIALFASLVIIGCATKQQQQQQQQPPAQNDADQSKKWEKKHLQY
jgi:outer membrane biogenesis lipoprotein LolB